MKAYLFGVVIFALIVSCTVEQSIPPAPIIPEEGEEEINISLEVVMDELPKENLEQQEEALPQEESSGNLNIHVTSVIDGDTIKISTGETVRFICIDTPERGENYYAEATDYLKALVLNKEITLVKDISETDRYGRLLRYVYLGDTFVNYELVQRGYAKAYRYPPDIDLCDELEEAETRAKNSRLGMWGSSETNAPSSSSSEYICTSNSYNCGDFATHAQAQAVYESCGGINNDVHQLDRDKDGVACES